MLWWRKFELCFFSNIFTRRGEKKRPVSFSERVGEQLMDRCEMLMKREKLFLDPSLNLLAREMGTNRTYLSKAFKASGNNSFCHYVNTLRVEYAKECIKSSLVNRSGDEGVSALSLEDYAIESGFSSARNFSRWFKMLEGITPGQYVKWLRLL
jgi:AraC-like DNA-binding protein